MRGLWDTRDADMKLVDKGASGSLAQGVYLVRFDEVGFTGGGVQYQHRLRNDTGYSPTSPGPVRTCNVMT